MRKYNGRTTFGLLASNPMTWLALGIACWLAACVTLVLDNWITLWLIGAGLVLWLTSLRMVYADRRPRLPPGPGERDPGARQAGPVRRRAASGAHARLPVAGVRRHDVVGHPDPG